MKTIIKGVEQEVEFEVARTTFGEPYLKETKIGDSEEIVISVVDKDLGLSIGDELLLAENDPVIISKITKTLEGDVILQTNKVDEFYDESMKVLIDKLYEREMDKFFRKLKEEYPDAVETCKIFGKDEPSFQEFISILKTVKGDKLGFTSSNIVS